MLEEPHEGYANETARVSGEPRLEDLQTGTEESQARVKADVDEGLTGTGREEKRGGPGGRVAVIGVHGIARHPPGETTNAMADLLLSLPAYAGTAKSKPKCYEPFKAVGIRIPLEPVRVCNREPVVSAKTTKFSLEEESAKFAAYLKPKGRTRADRRAQTETVANAAAEGGTDTGNEYTRLLLESYQGGADTNVYVTTRLEGSRKGSEEKPAAKVDIYEVLWADLAHPESSVVGFFLSLFTLLFHLGSLSRLAIDTGAGEQDGKMWSTYLWSQRWAVRILQIFAPLLKVLLLLVILSAIPGVSRYLVGNWGCAVVVGCLGGVGVGLLIFKSTQWRLGRNPWVWGIAVLAPGVIGAAAGYGLSKWLHPEVAGSIEAWLFVGVPLLGFLLKQYESYRNGVQVTGWIGYGVCFAGYLGLLARSGWVVPQASFWLVELLVAGIRVAWLGMCGLAGLALVLGWLLCLREKNKGKRARLRAAVRTSRFALAMPAVLFLLITPLIWAALFQIADRISKPYFVLETYKNHGPGRMTHWLVKLNLIPDLSDGVVRGDYLHALMGWAMGYQLPITLVLVLLAFFLLLWFALPSALLERFPQRDQAEAPRSSTNKESFKLGMWLSRGLDATTVVTGLFWGSLFAAFPAVYLLKFYPGGWYYSGWVVSGLRYLTLATEMVVTSLLVGVGFAALVAIVKYGSSVLETILDIDTYLRTSPEDATPRAKIFERFVSTLRYVAQHKDAHGQGYDSVVIVAHSLGSLISADLLRFLYAQKCDPELARFGFGKTDAGVRPIRLRLLTMGSPIRQLLNRFFPYLYDWVRPQPDNGLGPLPAPSTSVPPRIKFPKTPDAHALGVELWVNTYRSGDYVGRSLWLDEWYYRTDPEENPEGRFPEPIYEKLVGGAGLEMCIGAGAHTHYWDDTAPDVAEVLDWMI